MEYFAGQVTLVEQDTVHVKLTRFNGEVLGPVVNSVYVLHLPNHTLQVGDYIGANIVKYGHLDNRPDTIEQPTDSVSDGATTEATDGKPYWTGNFHPRARLPE